MSQKDIEAVGRNCPLLKTLILNEKAFAFCDDGEDDMVAASIGKNLTKLTHLELIGNNMTNIGLQAILDGCCHLESLDLRRCLNVNLTGDLGKRCLQQIRRLKLPDDSLAGCRYPQMYNIIDDFDIEDRFFFLYDEEYYGYSD